MTTLAETRAVGADKTLLSPEDLAAAGLIAQTETASLGMVAARYSIAVTPQIAALIDRDDPADPIARQFLPDRRELLALPGELADPIGDAVHSPLPGVVHRYADRVLLKLLTVCPVYCRFCFRRETVGRGKGDILSFEETRAALDYIAANPKIYEVILTGGDPLALSPRRLRVVAGRLAAIPHVKVLRVHTRAPTAAPALVTPEWLNALKASGKALFVALHVNHARELNDEARAAIARLHDAGATLLSQTVLLAGVNDDAETLETLMRALMSLRIKPYYLHHPDKAPGAGHFRLTLARGRAIYAALARRLGGPALPTYVLDLPGGFGKARVAAGDATPDAAGGWRVTDRSGRVHVYNDGPAPPQD
jgi:lysine 2,3-aminomutase